MLELSGLLKQLPFTLAQQLILGVRETAVSEKDFLLVFPSILIFRYIRILGELEGIMENLLNEVDSFKTLVLGHQALIMKINTSFR